MRFRLRAAVAPAVSLVSLGAVAIWASKQGAPRFPTSAEPLGVLALALAAYAVATVVRGWRWHRVLVGANVRHHAADAYALTPVAYMGNTVLPARGGEILRIVLMAPRSDARKREIFGTVLAERVLDVVALVALFAVVTWTQIGGAPAGQAPALGGLATLGFGSLVLALYLALRRKGRFESFAALIRPVARASAPLLGRSGLVLAIVTAGVWLLEALVFALVGESLGVKISVLEGLMLVVLTSFFALVPAAPGYVGTYDAAMLFGLAALGVHGAEAVSFLLLARFVQFVPITLVGMGLMLFRYGGLSRAFRIERTEAAGVGAKR